MAAKRQNRLIFSLLIALLLAGLIVWDWLRGRKMGDEPPTQEQIMKMAQEVQEGKRPPEDIEKYGYHLGPSREIDAQTFMKMVNQERAATQSQTTPSR